MIKIKIGELCVYESGFIYSFQNTPIDFHLKDEGPLLVVRLLFIDDASKGESVIEAKSASTNLIELKHINFKEKIGGVCFEAPMRIGIFDNKELYLQLHIETTNNKNIRKVSYCWYLGKEVTNG